MSLILLFTFTIIDQINHTGNVCIPVIHVQIYFLILYSLHYDMIKLAPTVTYLKSPNLLFLSRQLISSGYESTILSHKMCYNNVVRSENVV